MFIMIVHKRFICSSKNTGNNSDALKVVSDQMKSGIST